MRVNIEGVVGEQYEPGLTAADLERVNDDVAAAHNEIDAARQDGEFGYAALAPDPDTEAITKATRAFDPAAILTIGMGGSALPAAALTETISPSERKNGTEERSGKPPHYVLDTIDPEHVPELLSELSLTETLVHVVSRSGTTAETLANANVVFDAIEGAGGEWTEQTLVTTGPRGPLHDLVEAHDLPSLPAPSDMPGRFGVLTPAGLVPPAVQGYNIEAIVNGAQQELDGLHPSLFETPAYAYGAVAYALAERGATDNVLLPYSEALGPLVEWFAQLWAESLGKDGWGQTPVRSMGARDQHSQLQLYCDGPDERFVTVISPAEYPTCAVPNGPLPEDVLDEASLEELQDSERRTTISRLLGAGTPTVELDVRRDEENVGKLVGALMAATILVGELADVETFTQPAVEGAKDEIGRESTVGTGQEDRKNFSHIE